jgi:pimeloyl-ACP methyl ester carboxylesterase
MSTSTSPPETTPRREGTGEPLMLLHGVTGSGRMWDAVLPLVAAHHDTIVPTALGHRGGRPVRRRPVRIADVVDDAQRTLDELGIERAHLAGNSMGGWVALELARRGRARSVCALSPAGFWDAHTPDHARATGRLKGVTVQARLGRPLLPLAARAAAVRRFALREVAAHGARVTPAMTVALTDDLLGCDARDDLLATDEQLAPLDPPPCPITIAWSARDRIFPIRHFESRARERVPGATFVALGDVGHVPMLDDPGLVARTILGVTGGGAPRPIPATPAGR